MRALRVCRRVGHCVCGLKVAHHFDNKNRKLSCVEARELHPRARRKRVTLAALTVEACFNRTTNYFTGLRPTHGVIIGAIGMKL